MNKFKTSIDKKMLGLTITVIFLLTSRLFGGDLIESASVDNQKKLQNRSVLTRCVLDLVKVYNTETVETSLDVEGKRTGPALNALKSEMVKMIARYMNEKHPLDVDACVKEIKNEIEIVMKESESLYNNLQIKYGKEGFYAPVESKNVSMEKVSGYEGLVVVIIKYTVVCGEDDSFYLFEFTDNGYKLILQDIDTNDKSFGYENLEYVFSKPENSKDYFILLANGKPWCTSCWGRLQYRVMRPGASPEKPNMLIAKDDYMYRCSGIKLNAGKDGFEVRFIGSQSMSTDFSLRTYLRKYILKGNSVDLVAPIADYPEDAIDEWLKMPEDVAASFVEDENKAEIFKWRELIKSDSRITAIKFVQSCNEESGLWEIGVQAEGKKLPQTLYFNVLFTDEVFKVLRIADNRKGDCQGEAPPEKHNTELF